MGFGKREPESTSKLKPGGRGTTLGLELVRPESERISTRNFCWFKRMPYGIW